MKRGVWYCLCSLVVLVLFLGLTVPVSAAAYPDKPIKVIVPFNPGGMSDTFTRIFQKALKDVLPQPLVVINMGGAGGAIGSRKVKDSDPDGYTVLNIHVGLLTAAALGATEYGPEAFEPVAQTGTTYVVQCVRKDSPFKTLKDLMEAARAKPDAIKEATNIGAVVHFTSLMLTDAAGGVKLRLVQSGGGANRTRDLLGGHVDTSAFSTTEFKPYYDSGEMRALAILAPERQADFPDVPTAREQGYDVVFGVGIWWFMPKGTPADRVSTFADALEKGMKDPEVQANFKNQTMSPVFKKGEAFKTQIDAEYKAINAMAEKYKLKEMTKKK